MAPPLDDDDIPEKTSTGKPGAKERMAERASKAAKGEIDASEEDAPVIDVSDRDDDDGDDEPVPKGSVRQEKKRNRYREMQERANAADQARKDTEARFSQMLNLYEKTIAAQQRPQVPQQDEHDARLEAIYREQETLYTELQVKANRLSQADKDRIEKRAKELDSEKIAVAVQKHIKQNGGNQQPRGPAETMQSMLQIEYPDVVAHEDALGWSQGYYQMARREGRPAGIELAREAMAKARQRFRIGGNGGQPRRPPAPSALKEKYAGVGQGGGGRDPDSDREEVVMSKPFRKMANGKYGHIKDEKKRYEMWAQGPGKRLLAASRAKHSV